MATYGCDVRLERRRHHPGGCFDAANGVDACVFLDDRQTPLVHLDCLRIPPQPKQPIPLEFQLVHSLRRPGRIL